MLPWSCSLLSAVARTLFAHKNCEVKAHFCQRFLLYATEANIDHYEISYMILGNMFVVEKKQLHVKG